MQSSDSLITTLREGSCGMIIIRLIVPIIAVRLCGVDCNQRDCCNRVTKYTEEGYSESESEWSHVVKKHSLEGRDSEPDHTGLRIALGCESPHLPCYYGIGRGIARGIAGPSERANETDLPEDHCAAAAQTGKKSQSGLLGTPAGAIRALPADLHRRDRCPHAARCLLTEDNTNLLDSTVA